MPSTPPPPPPQAAPQTSWPAIYYDGKSSARQSVTIHLQPSGLDLLWPNGTRAWWPSREIRQTQGTYANEPIRLEHTAGRLEAMPETLVIEDPAFLAALTRVVREQPHVASQTMSPSRHFQRIILAAIVEKETGQASERGMIAGVFVNRLRLGMLLQTDPTVIYGMGNLYQGKIRKRDLERDTPYNTYTRAGLPPTPIALPSKESLQAALAPAPPKALYFVARGDGSRQFSTTLQEHNRAVNQYQR